MKYVVRYAAAALAVCLAFAAAPTLADAPAFVADTMQSASFDLSTAFAWASAAWALVSTPAAVAGATGFLMAVLPQGEPGSKWDTARTILNFVAMNWGNAKNLTLKG